MKRMTGRTRVVVCPMPMRLRLVFAAAASLLAAAPAQAAFVDVSPPRLFRPFVMLLTDSIGKSIGRALPVPAASAGIIYDFDPLRGTFVRAVSPAGQIFLERPDPIARGHVNFSLAYERIRFDTLDGKRLESLRDTVPIPLRQSFAYTRSELATFFFVGNTPSSGGRGCTPRSASCCAYQAAIRTTSRARAPSRFPPSFMCRRILLRSESSLAYSRTSTSASTWTLVS